MPFSTKQRFADPASAKAWIKSQQAVSFVELLEGQGFGNHILWFGGNEDSDILAWAGMSKRGREFAIEVLTDAEIAAFFAEPAIYAFDGMVPRLPVYSGDEPLTQPGDFWCPLVLHHFDNLPAGVAWDDGFQMVRSSSDPESARFVIAGEKVGTPLRFTVPKTYEQPDPDNPFAGPPPN